MYKVSDSQFYSASCVNFLTFLLVTSLELLNVKGMRLKEDRECVKMLILSLILSHVSIFSHKPLHVTCYVLTSDKQIS